MVEVQTLKNSALANLKQIGTVIRLMHYSKNFERILAKWFLTSSFHIVIFFVLKRILSKTQAHIQSRRILQAWLFVPLQTETSLQPAKTKLKNYLTQTLNEFHE